MKRFAVQLAVALLVLVRLPNGAPAKHASVRMTKMGANYQILSLEVETTNAAGKAVFNMRPGACLKAEYGRDAQGRPLYIGHVCPGPSDKTATIDLSK